MKNCLLVKTSPSNDSCLEKTGQDVRVARSEIKASSSQKDNGDTGQTERLLGMFSFVG